MNFPFLRAKERLIRIMNTFDLATGHADTWDELLNSLESELRDVLGYYREALAQPAQAPEIYSRWQETIAGIPVIFESEADANRFMEYHLANAGKPIEQPAQQEPVAKYSDIVSDGGLDPRNKFDATPQRTWVGLTDDEINKTFETKVWDARRSYARAIEAKLKEKNT